MKTISFFGHRKIFDKTAIQKNLTSLLDEFIPKGYFRILVGRHGDFDKLVLETCINYKKNIDERLNINVVLTSLSYLNKNEYGYSVVDNYKDKGCDTIFYEIEDVYFKKRITVSNKKMIDESDLIICYVNENVSQSGAKTAINYAYKHKKTVINLF